MTPSLEYAQQTNPWMYQEEWQMRKVIVGIILGTIVFTSGLWASGGKNRHGQDGTQPKTRQQRSAGEQGMWGQCLGTNACVRANGSGQEMGTRQWTRKQIRKQDGTCQSAKQQIRDRKRDGSCQSAATQQRSRTRQQSRSGC